MRHLYYSSHLCLMERKIILEYADVINDINALYYDMLRLY